MSIKLQWKTDIEIYPSLGSPLAEFFLMLAKMTGMTLFNKGDQSSNQKSNYLNKNKSANILYHWLAVSRE